METDKVTKKPRYLMKPGLYNYLDSNIYSSSAATPGNTLPSINSSSAPPPVEI